MSNYLEKFKKIKIKEEMIKKNLSNINGNIKTIENEIKTIENSQIIIQKVAQETQQNLKFRIEDVVQTGLDICFPEIKFETEFEIKRGKTEACFYFRKDGNQMQILDSSGGGVIDITSLTLRLAAWSLSNTDNVIILDEPIKNISKEYKYKTCQLIKELSDKMGLQFIIVTHDSAIIDIADKVFEVKQKDRVSFLA